LPCPQATWVVQPEKIVQSFFCSVVFSSVPKEIFANWISWRVVERRWSEWDGCESEFAHPPHKDPNELSIKMRKRGNRRPLFRGKQNPGDHRIPQIYRVTQGCWQTKFRSILVNSGSWSKTKQMTSAVANHSGNSPRILNDKNPTVNKQNDYLMLVKMTTAREGVDHGSVPKYRAIWAHIDGNFLVTTARVFAELKNYW
jgi:hypothetical protein